MTIKKLKYTYHDRKKLITFYGVRLRDTFVQKFREKCKQRLDRQLCEWICKSVRQRKPKKKIFKMGLSRASLWKETKVLFHPYYWINIILCASFVFMRLVSPFCQILFGPGKEACELDMRENEILFFSLQHYKNENDKKKLIHPPTSYMLIVAS